MTKEQEYKEAKVIIFRFLFSLIISIIALVVSIYALFTAL